LVKQITQSNERILNPQTFNALLGWLHPEREKAGELYEQIRIKLIRYFECQGCPLSEEYADDTIQRVARKISEGVEVRAGDPYTYFRGVARNALLEYWKGKERKHAALDDLPPGAHPSVNPNQVAEAEAERASKERALECLEHCLNRLPAESRELFLDYHRDEKRDRIDNRNLVAQRLGIDITALRNRVTRLREKLEKCVSNCTQQ
jgi:RNA polymerase sigma factor (sigma-70 family)